MREISCLQRVQLTIWVTPMSPWHSSFLYKPIGVLCYYKHLRLCLRAFSWSEQQLTNLGSILSQWWMGVEISIPLLPWLWVGVGRETLIYVLYCFPKVPCGTEPSAHRGNLLISVPWIGFLPCLAHFPHSPIGASWVYFPNNHSNPTLQVCLWGHLPKMLNLVWTKSPDSRVGRVMVKF